MNQGMNELSHNTTQNNVVPCNIWLYCPQKPKHIIIVSMLILLMTLFCTCIFADNSSTVKNVVANPAGMSVSQRNDNPNNSLSDKSSPFIYIPIVKYGNRDLTDDVPNDGKGGWTDEGTNDLCSFKTGTLKAQGIPFEIGNRVIVLKSLQRPAFPMKSPIMPIEAKVERLCFCHTVTWGGHEKVSLFHYHIIYADGTEADIPMIQTIDIVDWWNSAGGPNAKIAWNGNAGEHSVSIFHSQWKNPKPEIEVKSIQVISDNQRAIPVILGITAVRSDRASGDLIRNLDKDFSSSKVYIAVLPKEKEDWYKCQLDLLGNIEKNSVLDASFINSRPAGKYGFLKKVGNHFEFEKQPGRRAIFWGTNLCYGATRFNRELAIPMARTLARRGINIIRMHMWAKMSDTKMFPEIAERNLMRPDGTMDPVLLDDMHFFHSELIRNGIYIYMDIYDTDHLIKGMLGKTGNLSFQPEINDAVKKMAKTLLTTVNPYTGKSMVDDPAYVMFEIKNESSCTFTSYSDTPLEKSYTPEVYKIILKRWDTWKKVHGISLQKQLVGAPQNMDPEARRFFASLQKEHIDDMRNYLHSIGVKVPVCGTNLELTAGDLWASQNMDFMNDHVYISAISTGGGLWQPQNTSITNSSLNFLPFFGEIVHSRLYDKPIVCTEWCFVYPGMYRCEGYPITAAYSAFQGFDAMFSYDCVGAYLGGYLPWLVKNPRVICLSQILDPSTWGLNQAAAIAFLRGDIKPARKTVTAKYTEDDVWQNRRQLVNTLSFMFQMCRVNIKLLPHGAKTEWPLGTGKEKDALYSGAVKRLRVKSGTDFITSDTGEITHFSDPGLFLIDTPKSQFAVGALYSMANDKNRVLSAFSITSPMKFATLTFTSMDNLPLVKSRRILCCAVGNSANTGSYIDDKGYFESHKSPILTEPVTATIFAKAVDTMPLKVYKIDPATGERISEMNITVKDNIESFTIDKNSKTMYFELVR